MLPVQNKYAIWPSIVPSDSVSEVVITATEKAFVFPEDKEFKITVIPTNTDTIMYNGPVKHKFLMANAHKGVLRFSWNFFGEQEYTVVVSELENEKYRAITELHMFALKEDLYALRPLKGDLHAHTYRSDGQSDPSALAGYFREYGYDFFSLADHNRYYGGEEIDETYEGVKLGLTKINGEEVHVPKNTVHIVHSGGKASVAELYFKDPETHEKELEAYIANVPENIPEQYRVRYAQCKWACDKIHSVDGLAIFPHPHWRPGSLKAFNVCEELATLLLESGMFDVYEILGCAKQVGNNRNVNLWQELRVKGLDIPVVGSSDVHELDKSDEFPHLFTVCFAESREPDDIIKAVKQGYTVAVEATGVDYTREYRTYGTLRLTTYAHFLLQYFFPIQERLAMGEGVAMRNYCMEECGKEVVELQAAIAEDYALRFLGRKEPKLPSEKIIDFAERRRERQMRGPRTKGSQLDGKENRQL